MFFDRLTVRCNGQLSFGEGRSSHTSSHVTQHRRTTRTTGTQEHGNTGTQEHGNTGTRHTGYRCITTQELSPRMYYSLLDRADDTSSSTISGQSNTISH